MSEKIDWFGTVISVQPRFRLLRQWSHRQHNYPGFVLKVDGKIDDHNAQFTIAIGKGAQSKFYFRAGDEVSGRSQKVVDVAMESADYYKTSALKLLMRESEDNALTSKPPYVGPAPEIEVYRQRGHRRLDADVYAKECQACVWGALMPTQVMADNYNPKELSYRKETFCYGPKSCRFYQPGSPRQVESKAGDVWIEPDSVDEEETKHRKSGE